MFFNICVGVKKTELQDAMLAGRAVGASGARPSCNVMLINMPAMTWSTTWRAIAIERHPSWQYGSV